MESAVQELLNSPKLALHVRVLKTILAHEHEARERFYLEWEGRNAEFINGRVVVPEPVPMRHTRTSGRLLALTSAYVQARSRGYVGHGKLSVALTRNAYEPDVCFFNAQKAASFAPDQIKFPAPDLAVEVLSPGTEKNDRGVKFEDYAAHGVTEYWIIDPEAQMVEQYVLEGERYALRMKLSSGELASVAARGFAVPVRALFDDEENLRVLRRLLSALPSDD